jgi:putative phosphoesterase
MMRILVISDTHGRDLSVLPSQLLDEVKSADIVVHCGDYHHLTLLNQLRKVARRFVGVFGNIDSIDVRAELPAKAVFEVEGKRFGVIHPHWGGPPHNIERDIVKEFDGVDVICFGHTHDAGCREIKGVTFLNPGQSYRSYIHRSYMEPASAGIVNVGPDGIEVEIKTFK